MSMQHMPGLEVPGMAPYMMPFWVAPYGWPMMTPIMPAPCWDHDGSFRIEAVQGHVVAMSFTELGCRMVQQWFDDPNIHKGDKLQLAKELRGYVVAACLSQYANHVVQRILEVLPASDNSFIGEEINGSEDGGLWVAKHKFGCRVVQRLIEQCDKAPGVVALIGTVLDNVEEFSRHRYGHYVVTAILEHGQPEQRQRVADACREKAYELAQDAYAGYVVAFILKLGSEQDRQTIQERLFAHGPDGLVALTRGNAMQSGTQIIEELLRQDGQQTEQLLRRCIQELRTSKHGRRLITRHNLEDGQVEEGK